MHSQDNPDFYRYSTLNNSKTKINLPYDPLIYAAEGK